MKKNIKSGAKKPMRDFKHQRKEMKVDDITIAEISQKNLHRKVAVHGVIERIIQTSGPTIFEVFDGTGRIPLKAFITAGERAYPTIVEGDYVKAIASIEEFQGELEGDIDKLFKKEGEGKETLEKLINLRLRKRAEVKDGKFLVKSQILDKLKPGFVAAATEIRLAIMQARPIIVRHHNDTDGYSSGFALERAIIPLIEKEHSNPKATWEYFTRAPCAAPYYEIEDSIKDTANSLRNVAKFSNKMPLIIIADNGSTEQDLMAILQAKIHGADFIVIDHHKFGEDLISQEVLVHINPFLVGENGSAISAGQLCVELGRFINQEVKNIDQIGALAGIADRIDLENEDIVNQYLKIAEKEGYSRQLLNDLSLVVEYVSTRLRFMEAREYIGVVFGEPRERQKKLVELMAPFIRNLDLKGLAIARDNAIIEEINGVKIQKIMIEETFPGFGFFPKPGRSVGLVHDAFKSEGNDKLVSMGVMNTAITFRATDSADFSVQEFMNFLNEKLPEAFVEGGGHKNAGAISYLPKFKARVLELFNEYMKK